MPTFKISQFVNANGNPNANHYVIEKLSKGKTYLDDTYFQSYDSIVCKVHAYDHKVSLARNWDWGYVTRKHLYEFLADHGYYGLTRKKVKALIKNGTFTLSHRASFSIGR